MINWMVYGLIVFTLIGIQKIKKYMHASMSEFEFRCRGGAEATAHTIGTICSILIVLLGLAQYTVPEYTNLIAMSIGILFTVAGLILGGTMLYVYLFRK